MYTGKHAHLRPLQPAFIMADSGETVTYGELARTIGSPRAARAVGQANHRNPLGIIVPCHRVVASAGLGG